MFSTSLVYVEWMDIFARITQGLLFSLLLTTCTSLPPAPVESSEQLLATPPPGWKLVYQLNNIASRLSDFSPQGETNSEWKTKLSFESFSELRKVDPIQAMSSEVEQDKKRCNFVQHFNLFSGFENNFPTSVSLFMCGKNLNSDFGEVKMIKSIQGNDYLYVVTLIRKIDPFKPNEADFKEEEIAAWSTYFRGISLCDNKHQEHICPQP